MAPPTTHGPDAAAALDRAWADVECNAAAPDRIAEAATDRTLMSQDEIYDAVAVPIRTERPPPVHIGTSV